MEFNEILEQIAAFSPRHPDQVGTPEPAIIAFVVRMARGLRQWKKSTLANFAGVSLSSIERVERAEVVSNDTLDKVSNALGYHEGAFTQPRLPLSPEQVLESMTETYGYIEPVEVAPLVKQAQVRRLASCHGFLVHGPEVPDELRHELTGLYEWLDLASFILTTPDASEAARRRVLYGDILEHVRGLERSGFTVLAGTMVIGDSAQSEWRVAILTVTPKATDPGAPKRKTVFVDRRCLRSPYHASPAETGNALN